MYNFGLPKLTAWNHRPTSPATPRYNCISHAVHEDLIPLWPDDDNFWPVEILREETVDAFVSLFEACGFIKLLLSDVNVEWGFERVAIYALNKVPTHAARQLATGRWTSKLGTLADIEHADLQCLEGERYGLVTAVMKRPATGRAPALPEIFPKRPLIILP